jgi:hypothetical protein
MYIRPIQGMIIEEISYYEAIKRVFGYIHLIINKLFRDIHSKADNTGRVQVFPDLPRKIRMDNRGGGG